MNSTANLTSIGLNYCGALCETDCVGPNLGRNKDHNYNCDKCGAFRSAGPTVPAYVECTLYGDERKEEDGEGL